MPSRIDPIRPGEAADETAKDLLREAEKGWYDDAALVELLLFASLEIGLARFCTALTLDTTDASRYPSGLEYPLEDPGLGTG